MKRKITHQSAKGKGRRLQKWVCEQVSWLTGFDWSSDGTDAPISSRPMGQPGTDIRMESQVIPLFPFSVECKYQETWGIPGWIQQAKANQRKGTDWLLVIKRNRVEPVVVMDAVAFFKLLEKGKK